MKKALKVIAIIVAALLLAIIIVPLTLRGKIDNIIKTQANEMLNAKLDFDKLGISLLRHFPSASVQLHNLSISGVDTFEGDTLASVKRVSVVVNLMSIFGDEFHVNKVIVDAPKVKAIKHADGSVNWDIVKDSDEVETSADTTSSSSGFKLSMKSVRLTSGEVIFADDSSSMQFYADNLDIDLRGDFSADQTTLNVALGAKNMYFVMDKIAMLSKAETQINADILADMKNHKFTFEKNTVRLNAIEMGLDGWVALKDDAVDMDLKVNAPDIRFRDLLSMVPALYTKDFKNLTASGQLALDAWAKGRMEGESFPAFNVKIDVVNGGFKYAELPRSVDNIQISAQVSSPGGSIDRTVVDVPLLALSMAGNSLRGSLHAETPVSDLALRAGAQGKVNLGMIKEVYPLDDSVSLGGIVTADIKVAGRMSDIEKERYEKISAEGTFTIEQMIAKLAGLPDVKINHASASISPKVMSLSKFDLTIGQSDLQAAGQLSNYLPYLLRGEMLSGNLNITSSLLDANELTGAMPSDEKTATEEPETELKAMEVPKNLNLALNVNARKILFQQMALTNLTGNVAVEGGALKMKKLDFNAMDGSINASGYYSTAQSVSNPELGLTANVINASFPETFKQLEMVRKIVPLFEKTGGYYSMSLEMTTKLDSRLSPELGTVNAKGMISSQEIKLQNLEVFDQLATLLKDDRLKNINAKDVKISFIINDGRLSTSPFDLKMGNIGVNLAGSTGLDQTIDYNAKIALPEGTAGGYVNNVNVHIGGTFTSPKITVGVKEVIQDAIKDVIKTEIIDKLTGGKDLNAEIEKQAGNLRAQAKSAGDKLVEAARTQSNKLVETASNPIAKLAAQKSADALVKKAEQEAAKLVEAAEQQIEKLKQSK